MKDNKLKRTYSAPQLEVIDVDHEISLVMASIPDSDIKPFEAAPETNPLESGPASTFSSSSESTPFGSSAPEYPN